MQKRTHTHTHTRTHTHTMESPRKECDGKSNLKRSNAQTGMASQTLLIKPSGRKAKRGPLFGPASGGVFEKHAQAPGPRVAGGGSFACQRGGFTGRESSRTKKQPYLQQFSDATLGSHVGHRIAPKYQCRAWYTPWARCTCESRHVGQEPQICHFSPGCIQ